MCRACKETPDNQGRHCNRPDGEFTETEADARNRSRNLNNATASLQAGDAQAAANSIARAVAAQQRIDGGPATHNGPLPTAVAPHRDFYVSPSQIQVAEGHLKLVNAQRQAAGLAPFDVTITKVESPIDDITVLQQAVVRVEGASPDELDRLSLGNTPSTAERRVRTLAVLAAGCAAVRQNGGVYAGRKDPGSIPNKIDAYVSDRMGGPARTQFAPNDVDRDMASKVRFWGRAQSNSNDWITNVRRTLAQEYISPREAAVAVSAIKGWQEHMQMMTARAERAQAQPSRAAEMTYGREPTRPGGSRWLGKPDQQITVTGRVERVERLQNPYGPQPKFLHVIRTPQGDLVRWLASSEKGLEEGDDVTLQGTIRANSYAPGGEKQTEMYYCQRPLIHQNSSIGAR